jgi:hypothetical protein
MDFVVHGECRASLPELGICRVSLRLADGLVLRPLDEEFDRG